MQISIHRGRRMTGGSSSSHRTCVLEAAASHVLLQRARHGERSQAELASVDVLSGPAVRLHVPREFARLGTRVVAQPTTVWLFAGVRSPVYGQVAAVPENFAAVFARVVPLASPRGRNSA